MSFIRQVPVLLLTFCRRLTPCCRSTPCCRLTPCCRSTPCFCLTLIRFLQPSAHRSFLSRRDHVQEHHGGQPRAHQGGHPQRDAQTRTRRVAGELHPLAAPAGQRFVLLAPNSVLDKSTGASLVPLYNKIEVHCFSSIIEFQ